MLCYNSIPLKRSFIPERSKKKYYAYGSQNQVVCPVETLFRDFDYKTLLHLATKSDDPRLLNDSIS